MNQKQSQSKLNKKSQRTEKTIAKKSQAMAQAFVIKRQLFNRGLFAAAALTISLLVIAIVLFISTLWYLALPLLCLFCVQISLEIYMFYQLNYGFANLSTIGKYKKVWIVFLLTGNLTGAIYIGLLIKK